MFNIDTLTFLKSDQNILLNEMLSNDLVLFGEDHNTNAGRLWIKTLVPKINKEFHNFGLEYIPSPDCDYISDQELLEKHLTQSYKDFPGFDPKSIIDIAAECKKNNLKVFGIDMPPDYFDDWQDPKNQKQRVKFMSKVVLDHLETGKTLALMGGDHVEKREDNLYGLVKKDKPNIKILSIIFIGGKAWTVDTEDYWVRELELLAIKQNLDKIFFILKNQENGFPCDFVIHFPQVEK